MNLARGGSSWATPVLSDLPPDERYLIGVSGGRDSVALLHFLLERGFRRLIVCQLDHRLRGRSGKADARFVERLALTNGLPIELGSADVRKLAKDGKQSIETTARAARHAFFSASARRRRCTKIFLAHHADDLVETFLMNLFRGAGSEGLGSMQPVSVHQVKTTLLTVIRPLLGVWRTEIDGYVAINQLKFREDLTNRSLRPTRNRVRHKIIPFLEKEFGRGIRKTLWRTAIIATEENVLLQNSLPQSVRETAKLPVSNLRQLPVALQRRAIRGWLRERAIPDVGFELIEHVRALLEPKNGPAKTNLPGNRHARRRAGELFIEG